MSNVLLGTAIGDALGVPFETKLVNNPELVAWDGKTFFRQPTSSFGTGAI